MPAKRRLNPKKLLHSKWTAAQPQNREKHFMVTAVLEPESPDGAIELVEIEAIYTQRRFTLAWQTLTDEQQWLQGWV